MTRITDIAVNNELMTFVNDPQSDSQCGLSRMLAWTWPTASVWNKNTSRSQPLWPATVSLATNPTAVNIAVLAVNNNIPSSSSLPTDLLGLIVIMLDTALLFSFAMLYNQLAKFQGVKSITSHAPIVALCVGAIAAAADPSVIPYFDPVTGTTSLESSLSNASRAVSSYLANADMTIPYASTLANLIPLMFTPVWTLSYYAAFSDGRMPDATFYDQRYAPSVVSSAFDSWISSLSIAASNNDLLDISGWLKDTRDALTDSTEGPDDLTTFFGSIRDESSSATSNINTLLATNAQFERRRGSIGALSDNLYANRKRTDFALTTMVLWIATVVACLTVAGILIAQKNYSLVTVLIIATITLLTVDSLWRALVASASE